MIASPVKKLIGGLGIAAVLSLGLANFTPAAAEGWRHEWREHHPFYGHPFYGYGPPVFYRPVHCFNRRIFVRGPWGWHPVIRRICRR